MTKNDKHFLDDKAQEVLLKNEGTVLVYNGKEKLGYVYLNADLQTSSITQREMNIANHSRLDDLLFSEDKGFLVFYANNKKIVCDDSIATLEKIKRLLCSEISNINL